jgi:hypothetical protein
MRKLHSKALIATGCLLTLSLSTPAISDAFSPLVDAQGNITPPTDFRMKMVHLGSWFVPAGGASGFHDVYTERESVEYYRTHGEFPDGATLVKELRAHSQATFTTGENVSSATSSIKQWFVMVKDAKDRFPNNPLWGDGWGWGLYKPDAPRSNVASDYRTDCLGCHIPTRETDLVYVKAYPSLSVP